MEGKQITNSVLLILSILLSVIPIPSLATALRYQTLVFNPRSQEHETPGQHNPSTEADPNSLTLDPLATPSRRDSLRLEALSNHVAAAATATQSAKSISAPVSSGALFGSMEYFVHLGVGTPAKQLYLALDTGSNLVWLQCLPCGACFNQSDPIFDPRKSTSFSPLSCDSPRCKQLVNTDNDLLNCSYSRNCLYTGSYSDDSYTTGNLSTETLTFGKETVDDVAIGCGHFNEGTMKRFAGILGLGRGSLSFPSQTGNKKFSYCLASWFNDNSDKSSITFGYSAVSQNANFTADLLQNPDSRLNSLYYVGLKGISVGGELVQGINPSDFKMDSNGRGGVIVDSGTTYTYLNKKAYRPLRDAFKNAMNLSVTNYTPFDTCYSLSHPENTSVPIVGLHFDAFDMDLPGNNYMINMDDNGTYCFGFAEQEDEYSIIGNMLLQGFRVSYDLANNLIGFTLPSDA
ncbi:hypothetical protein CASFOL_033662 [Castilleja foliolosa]|uniref:Peptidase A1 domain-containing protein n=1 Tax=Castilleja foliolosa TaxID=1961234 RepID=A0ABD3BXM5_9LAMI